MVTSSLDPNLPAQAFEVADWSVLINAVRLAEVLPVRDYLLRARSLDRHNANSKTVPIQKLKICPTTYFRL
ncbi:MULTISPECIES: hypothetical protein [unclassified Microcoleus]|uniref:hypothetical protein n=1 Tax=unclassified Microcoleus TaxID=2642155 RepID=UPI002FD43B38